MSRVRIENAAYVVTVDDTDTILRDTTVVVEDGVITEITGAEAAAKEGGASSRAADETVLDAGGKLLMPGLVNLHTHLPMTLLRGHFAMMLVCEGDAPDTEIRAALAPLADDGTLTVSVREVPAGPAYQPSGSPWVLTVHGGDRPGIVSAVVGEVASVGGNITDLTTRLAGDLYILTAEVDLPAGTDVASLQAALTASADQLGVGVTLRQVESDDL